MSKCTYRVSGRLASKLHAVGSYVGSVSAPSLSAARRTAKRGKHTTIWRRCNGVSVALAKCHNGECKTVHKKKARTSAYR